MPIRFADKIEMSIRAQTTRFLNRWGFVVGILGFAFLAGAAVYSFLEYRSFVALQVRTNDVVSQLREVEAVIERAETSQRGYLLTKNISFLQPYHKAIEAIDREVKALEFLVAQDSRQRPRAQRIKDLITARIAKMEALVRDSQNLSAPELRERIDLDVMEDLREVIGEMETEELSVLADRRRDSDRFSRLSAVVLTLGGLFALVLLSVSAITVRSSSKRNQAQAALITQVFESMTDGLLVIDTDLRVIHSNRASDEMSERTLKGMTLAEVYDHNRPSADASGDSILDYRNSSLYRALKGETVLRFEVMMGKTKRRLVSVDARAVRNDDGEIIAAFCTYRDITQRRETEEAWKNARESALEASRLKSDFLATMSHEIRTPMNGVMGMATLLLDTKLSAEQESYVRTIKSSSDSLLTLINQVLDHSKIEAGKLDLDLSDFDLETVIEGVMSLFRFLARSKDIELKIVVEPTVPPALNGDPHRLRQILLNLVGNALKFTERGFVELHVKTLDDSGHNLEFSVKDTGPGIPAEMQAQLFQKFSQVHDSKYVRAAGSGLGLMISRELVRLMGGGMGMESVVGLGSRFWFTAVFQPAKEVGLCEWQPREKREPMSGRILVAEDQLVNQMVIRKFLQSFGLECVMADEGGAAVTLAREENFDLIFMDCRMIPVDGYEATRQIRAFNPTIPILALTAEGVSGERQRCLDVGMNEVMTKPVDIDQLHRVLQKYLVKPEFSEAQLDKLSGYESDGKSLLEVLSEDFFTNGKALVENLSHAIENGDSEKRKSCAHALRSPSLTLGLMGLAKFCAELEDAEGTVPVIKIEKLNEFYGRACQWLGQQARSSKAS